jgi:hypothetical protein
MYACMQGALLPSPLCCDTLSIVLVLVSPPPPLPLPCALQNSYESPRQTGGGPAARGVTGPMERAYHKVFYNDTAPITLSLITSNYDADAAVAAAVDRHAARGRGMTGLATTAGAAAPLARSASTLLGSSAAPTASSAAPTASSAAPTASSAAPTASSAGLLAGGGAGLPPLKADPAAASLTPSIGARMWSATPATAGDGLPRTTDHAGAALSRERKIRRDANAGMLTMMQTAIVEMCVIPPNHMSNPSRGSRLIA